MSETPIAFSFEKLLAIANDFRLEQVSASETAARFVLLHLHARHDWQWLSGPRRRGLGDREPGDFGIPLTVKQRERLRGVDSVADLWARFFFRGVVLDSHEGLVGWLEGRYPLIPRLDIPTPDEMLAIQCEGQRYVTLLLEPEAQFKRYGRHADACDFLLHDFEHAHKFFGGEFRGQTRFFRALRASSFALWSADPEFVTALDYLKSDMNSHPVHLMKYLKAIVLAAEMRRTGLRAPSLDDFWLRLFQEWNMPADVLNAALTLNEPEVENTSAQIAVSQFFSQEGSL